MIGVTEKDFAEGRPERLAEAYIPILPEGYDDLTAEDIADALLDEDDSERLYDAIVARVNKLRGGV